MAIYQLHEEDKQHIADLEAKLAAAESRAKDAEDDRDDYRTSLRQAEASRTCRVAQRKRKRRWSKRSYH